MTNYTELDQLIKAVDAEETVPWLSAVGPLGLSNAVLFGEAQCGSLASAVALLEALLPGWDWEVGSSGLAAVFKDDELFGHTKLADASNPARALLLATLLAYRSMKEGK